ncbi:glycosyltransferase family 2 protein [Dyella choica]|uniref:Glycosyltransferase family 2 protein n=1 Tax=Dyella choica TaxID=1927959 RepID=A0A432M3T6_9GAMM|nr:glycosyltransferase family 2 protein [Dyella choica]RUL73097.1 glycosyltransferase family 2 protein [Dyella choica]
MHNVEDLSIAVVIPAYKVRSHVMGVISDIGSEVDLIYVVDDCCPEGSGHYVQSQCRDSRVRVIFNEQNLGVGGAVMAGYRQAVTDGASIIIKIDGDGQMDPKIAMSFALPIANGDADYTKGNRFFDLQNIQRMPRIRIFGNAVLSLLTKLSTGYWNIFDPTNGYTAVHASIVKLLPLEKISKRYFFETDMLFRLGTFRAVVRDIPMDAKYEDEVSNLKISKVLGEFLVKHVVIFLKRIFYSYYLRDMSLASLELPIGLGMFIIGGGFGISRWIRSVETGIPASAGTAVIASMLLIVGLQLILGFLSYDIENSPSQALHPILGNSKTAKRYFSQKTDLG